MDKYEGTVSFLINRNEYKAFFYGEEYKQGELTTVEFDHLEYPLEWDAIFKENKDNELRIEKEENSDWSFCCYGKIISINPVIADFGDISLELGNWTHDPKVIGEFIYWKIERLDIRKLK